MKNYSIFAISKEDGKILGLTETSFGYMWSDERVRAFSAEKDWESRTFWKVPHSEFYKERIERGIDFLSKKPFVTIKYGYNYCERIKGKGMVRKMKKAFADQNYKWYHACGRSAQEYEWKWVNHISTLVKPPKGFEVIICRTNSKHCPVKVDFSERSLMTKERIAYNKYNWRNLRFEMNELLDSKIPIQ